MREEIEVVLTRRVRSAKKVPIEKQKDLSVLTGLGPQWYLVQIGTKGELAILVSALGIELLCLYRGFHVSDGEGFPLSQPRVVSHRFDSMYGRIYVRPKTMSVGCIGTPDFVIS